jgi:hypothetical protein
MEPKPTPQTPPAKKPYATPVLHVYGSIAALTKSIDKLGNSDNGTGRGKNRT